MENTKKKNFIVITTLVSVFAIYNCFVYTQGTSNIVPKLSEKAIKGEQLWQDNNCTSCHQFYGLGGYLGPDLTNVISHPQKGEAYVKAFLNSGVKVMPKFDFTEEEKDAIVEFLKNVDQTGIYPNKNAKMKATGWVELEYKQIFKDSGNEE